MSRLPKTPIIIALLLALASIAARAQDQMPRSEAGNHTTPESCGTALAKRIFAHKGFKDLNPLKQITAKPTEKLDLDDLLSTPVDFALSAKDGNGKDYTGYASFAVTCWTKGTLMGRNDKDYCHCSLLPDRMIQWGVNMYLDGPDGRVFDSAYAGGYYGADYDERGRRKP